MIVPVKSITKSSNSNLSPLIYPLDQPVNMVGCKNSWRIGATTKDTGYSIVGSQINAKPILGLYNFRQESGTEKMLATLNDSTGTDTELYYRTSGAWTEIPAAQTAWGTYKDMNVEMESFLGYCFFVGHNGTSFLPVGSLTGTTFSTATNVTSMPQGKFVKRYNGQLYVANARTGGVNYPFRIYKSSFPTAGAITWTVATDFLDVDYSEQITGFETAFGKLVAFTEYQAYFYDGSSWTPQWAYGCSAHRTIKKSGSYLFWGNFDGVWVSTGGQPQCISGEIEDFYRTGTPRNYFSEIVDEEYHIYLGNVTVKGVSYANLEAVFNIAKSIWYFRELHDVMTSYARYNNSGKIYLYMGTSLGQVMNKGKYTDATILKSDNGSDISSSFELAPFHLDSIDKFKKLDTLIAYSDRAMGLKLKARVVDSVNQVLMPYKPIGELTKFINTFDVSIDDGVIIQIAGSESGQNEYWSFLGYALGVSLSGNIPKY